MYKHILVPLDQSELAEQALPHAADVAEAMQAEISLIAVVAVVDTEATKMAGAVADWEAEVEVMGEYLQGLAGRLADQSLTCHHEVLAGDIGEEILRYAEENDCDLIVMSTHGRSGLGRWVYGSVADRILTHTHIPILMVRASEEEQG